MASRRNIRMLLPATVLVLALFAHFPTRVAVEAHLGFSPDPTEEPEHAQSGGADAASEEDAQWDTDPPDPGDEQAQSDATASSEPEESGAESAAEAEDPPGQPARDEIADMEELGNWTHYNGLIAQDATIYDSQSGGGLAVGGSVAFRSGLRIGSTYTSEYDPTLHIGEYRNEGAYPTFLFGGDALQVGPAAHDLHVFGGPIVMTQEMLDENERLDVKLTPKTDSAYRAVDEAVVREWFDHQFRIAGATAQLMLQANDVSIDIAELGDGSYLEAGPDAYRNQTFAVDGAVYERALFVTVRTDSEINFGQWWPVHSVITVDVNWAIDYDLLVFNFPDAVNVTMNSSTFLIENTNHWSTTVDAWVGERGAEERRALAEKVVYNFPRAASVEATQALIQGTVLAPNATFTGVGFGDHGHIYGHIVAKNYVARGNFTIHAFTLTHWIYDIVEDAITEPAESGTINLRHYLFFQGEKTAIRASGGEFVMENDAGQFYDGGGGFVERIDDAAVFSTVPGEYTRIERVPPGEYSLVQTGAPEGFSINLSNIGNPHTFYRAPVHVGGGRSVVDAVRYSEPEVTDLYFRKTDAVTGDGLAGATFTIVREGDEYQDATIGGSFTSDGNGDFSFLRVPVGRYHLVEVETPPNYELLESGEFVFEVAWDAQAGALVLRDARGERLTASAEEPLELPNRAGEPLSALIVVKYAQDPDGPETFYPLPGAQFALYRFREASGLWEQLVEDAAGEPVGMVTNALGYCRVRNLAAGRYRIVETRSPSGYALSNQFGDLDHLETFPHGYAEEVVFPEESASHTAYLLGKALELDIAVAAVGSPFEEPEPLGGVVFQLEHLLADGATWEELLYAAETGEDGEILLADLPAGAYRLTQTDTAAGFRALAPGRILFAVAFDENGAPSLQVEHGGDPVGIGTHPVSTDYAQGARIVIELEAKTRGYTVYKIDAQRDDGDAGGEPQPAYLEGAVFRLRRRPSTRAAWQDYGGPFRCEWQYDEQGAPLLDSRGNHIAAARFAPGLLYGDYQLVEMATPEGYAPGSDIEIAFDDGETGSFLHLFAVTEGMADSGGTSTYTAENHRTGSTALLRFRTVLAADRVTAVPGAGFALYHCERRHVHDTELQDGSCWTVSTPVTATGNRDGVVSFPDLETGAYMLRQDRVPAGYQLPNTLWEVWVDAAADNIEIQATSGSPAYAFEYTADAQAAWLLPLYRQWQLPGTGGRGTGPFWRASLLWMAAAGIAWSAARAKQKTKTRRSIE